MIISAAFLLASLFYVQTVGAQPGDAADPVVTKSYVDGQLEQLRQLVNNLPYPTPAQSPPPMDSSLIVSDVLSEIEALYGDMLRQPPVENTGFPQAQAPFETVFAPAGSRIIGDSGAEIILRGGGAVAVTGVNGLCDVTSGADIVNGGEIPLNHLLIVPASDGRGLVATYDAYLMIKGGYYFVE
jgi:hypothetical protein